METLTELLLLEHLSFGISALVSHPVFSWDPTVGFKKPLEEPVSGTGESCGGDHAEGSTLGNNCSL